MADDLWAWLSGDPSSGPRRALCRHQVSLSGEVVRWARDSARTPEELAAFAALLLRLDADPTLHSEPALSPNAPPGLRWAPLGARRVILQLDPGAQRIRLVTCR